MEFKEGYLSTFDINEELENLAINKDKPSSRILQSDIGLKSIALLKKIKNDHNHSWYSEVYNRACGDMDKTALFYRGNKISYRKMFQIADKLACSFKKAGIEKNDEIPCCLANIPELVYVMLAANKIGAKLNLFGSDFDPDYLHQIIEGTSKKLFIGSDREYMKIKDIVNNFNFENKVIPSLSDSLLENPELSDEYEKEYDSYYHYDNFVPSLKSEDESIMSFNEFLQYGEDYKEEIVDDNDLETEFTVTYTSGSTRIGIPKAIIHCNRSYIVGGIFNNTNLTGSPEVPEIRGLAHIHSESNTNLVTCISDNLIKHGSVALETEYSAENFLDRLVINKPVHLDATPSFLIRAAKDFFKIIKTGKNKYDNCKIRYYREKLSNQIVTMGVGEGTSRGEERLVNRVLFHVRAGSKISLGGLRLPFGPLSIGGADCEHGGIFYTLLKGIQEFPKKLSLRNKEYGMVPVPFAVVTALKKMEDGSYEECNYDEYGIIVANSMTSMKGYKNNPEATKKKVITDKYGRNWLSCDVYGYVNKLGNVVMKGRVGDKIITKNGQEVLPFMIDDIVTKDSKNVLSSSTVLVNSNSGVIPVINLEVSPLSKKDDSEVISSVIKRVNKKFRGQFDYAIRNIDKEKSFPLTGAGKRNIRALQEMGLDNTIRVFNEYSDNYESTYDSKIGKVLRNGPRRHI